MELAQVSLFCESENALPSLSFPLVALFVVLGRKLNRKGVWVHLYICEDSSLVVLNYANVLWACRRIVSWRYLY